MRSFKLIEETGKVIADLNRTMVEVKTEAVTPEDGLKKIKETTAAFHNVIKDEKID